jgi:hypothetical protein
MLRSVVNDDQALTIDRIRAAEIMFDRILGKPPESVALDIAGRSSFPSRSVHYRGPELRHVGYSGASPTW